MEDENSLNTALIEAMLREQDEEDEVLSRIAAFTRAPPPQQNNQWQTVSYQKRNRNKRSLSSSKRPVVVGDYDFADLNAGAGSSSSAGDSVFRSLELQSEEQRRRVAGSDSAPERSKRYSDDEDGDDVDLAEEGSAQNVSSELKKVKPKKPKKPKITVAEAASRINADYLAAFLAEITASYESHEDIQLMRFADYFGRAFSSVGGAQFPWLKMFKESTVAKIVYIPLSHISDDIYKVSTEWIGHKSTEALGSYVLWSLDSILADLASHQQVVKGSKKAAQPQPSSKSQVAIFVVLAIVIRRRPDVMISILPIMKESQKYLGQDKLPVIVWVIAQASQGDLVTGLYLWVSFLLPMLGSKTGCNPQSIDLILQSVERIMAFPKARPILLNAAFRKGERVVPPSALDTLLRVTFPLPSARVKVTERVASIYPTLKEVALAGTPGSKSMKQLTQQILSFAIKTAGEANPDLSIEACDIVIWCLIQNPECFKQWDSLYMDYLEGSVLVLKRLYDEWKEHFAKHPTLDPLRETLRSFTQKNEKEKAMAKVDSVERNAALKYADKYCKIILKRLSRGHGCMKSISFVSVILAVGAIFMSQNMHILDHNKLSEMLNLS